MSATWTIGRKIGAGFAAIVALAAVVAAIGLYGLRQMKAQERELLSVHRAVRESLQLQIAFERKIAEVRGFFFTRDDHFVDLMREGRATYLTMLERLEPHVTTEEGRRGLSLIQKAEAEHQAALERAIAMLKNQEDPEKVADVMRRELAPGRERIHEQFVAFVALKERLLGEAEAAAAAQATAAQRQVLGAIAAVIATAVAFALILGAALTRQVGTAIREVQESSTQLRSVATQQTTGARQQSSSMTEIATSFNELLATSRQIAGSAQRVAAIAGKTAAAGRVGEGAMRTALESAMAIRRQVDVAVGHMVDLGRRSQHITAVLEIINELSEQTNILAINATIEAAGSTQGGARFGVVADEIRKLADRVGGSTKEVRSLIDEIRASVHTSVAATEGGSKAVDAGIREFERVAASFRDIVVLVGTTTEAAQEIELSTRQQASGVEEVNVAIEGVAQSTRSTETSATEMLQTASRLSGLANDLMRLVRPHAAAA